jgi:hypothetical protein
VLAVEVIVVPQKMQFDLFESSMVYLIIWCLQPYTNQSFLQSSFGVRIRLAMCIRLFCIWFYDFYLPKFCLVVFLSNFYGVGWLMFFFFWRKVD